MNDSNGYLFQTYNGGFPFWLYGIFGLFTVYFVWKFVPETKGKSLEELEQTWATRHNTASVRKAELR